MRKILFFALVLNMITAVTLAEPVFRFDSTKQGDKEQKPEAPPQRPAYYDAYKKVKNETPQVNQTSQSSNSAVSQQIPKSTIPEETRQRVQEQMNEYAPPVDQ